MDISAAGLLVSTFLALFLILSLVSYAGVISENSGIFNLSLEGSMLLGATIGILFLNWFNKLTFTSQWSVIIAVLIGGIAGIVPSLIHARLSIRWKASQPVVGIGLNIAFFGLFMTFITMGTITGSSIVPNWARLTYADYSFIHMGGDGLALFIKSLLSGDASNASAIIMLSALIVVSLIFYKTRFGLRLRSCGDNPSGSELSGINVNDTRIIASVLSGFMSGVAGISFFICFIDARIGSTAGIAFLALAIVIIGGYKGHSVVLTSLIISIVMAFCSGYSYFDFLPQFTDIDGGRYIYSLGIPCVLVFILLIFSSAWSRRPKWEEAPLDLSKSNKSE